MRAIVASLLVLGSLGWIACLIELPTSADMPWRSDAAEVWTNDWRRTADGWERMSDWPQPLLAYHEPPATHPLALAGLQLLLSLVALGTLGTRRFADPS